MSHVIVVLTPQGHVKQVIGPFVNEHTASGWARAGDDRDRFESWFTLPLTLPDDAE